MAPPFLQHTLDNGLTVLLCPMADASTVSTWVFYRAGVRNELPGQTGISHWVEHMAFKGTARFGKGEIARLVNRHGGIWNGLTYYDWTAYFETLPAEHLDLALCIEADRMSEVLFEVDEVEAERTVVLAERGGRENDPGYLLNEEVALAALRVHPYRQPIVGWKEDLQRISGADLQRYYRTAYAPNNALLVLAGAIEAKPALAAVAAHFKAPSGPSLPAVQAIEPPQMAERRLILRRPGPTPILSLAFPALPAAASDWVPFLVLDAILSGAKGMNLFGSGTSTYRSARLYRALVETEYAVSVRSALRLTQDPGLFTIRAILRNGRTPEEVEPLLLAELERLAEVPPNPEELARTVRQLRAQLAYGSESTTAQAYWLGIQAMLGHPEHLGAVLEEVGTVQPEDVQRIAVQYLRAERRTVGWFVPVEGSRGEPGPDNSSTAWPVPSNGETARGEARGQGPAAWYDGAAVRAGTGTEEGHFSRASVGPSEGRTGQRCPLPAASVSRRMLPGGTILLVREKWAHPVVAVRGYLPAGGLFDPVGKEGLAGLCAQMLARGTQRYAFHELHAALEGVGAGLEFSAGQHAISFSGKSLPEDATLLLELLVEMLRRPTFPEEEWQRLRGETLTRLRYLEDSPDYVADRAMRELLYPPGHPHYRRVEGTAESVAAIFRQDLVDFYRDHFRPAGLVVAVAGDVAPAALEEHLGELLDGWQGSPPPGEVEVPRPPRPTAVLRAVRAIAGKAQSRMAWGVPGPARLDPDYYAAMVANVILGQLGLMGRLGSSVRDEQGLAYSVYSTLEAGVAAGPWSIRAGVAPQDVERAAAGIVREVGCFLEHGPAEEELADALSFLTGQLPLGLETNDGVAAALLLIERFSLGLDYFERYPAILEQLTREQILRAARDYLSTTGYVLAVAGPPETAATYREPQEPGAVGNDRPPTPPGG